jgi:hypothetical protein
VRSHRKANYGHIFDRGNGYRPKLKSEAVKMANKNLKLTSTVIIPTDKTNSFRCIHIDDYEKCTTKHLLKNGKEIPGSKLVQVFEDANGLLENLEHIMSEEEYTFVKDSINSKAIPSPKLLIKDPHKEINDNSNFPTRLGVLAINFTTALSKLGYIGIKRMADEAEVNYSWKTMLQPSDLNRRIESLSIRKDRHTIFSLDIEAFYPSVTCGLVERAIEFVSHSLGEKQKVKIKVCLKMKAFGMGNTLLMFINKCYKYDGKQDIQDKGLMIGSYESAWLADLVTAFILENTAELFDETINDRIYRDDGLVILDGVKSNAEVGEWLNSFQKEVNRVTSYE